ncbi:MAG: hypothetical protein ACXWCM_03460 [Acidimicrobiales bacterium]
MTRFAPRPARRLVAALLVAAAAVAVPIVTATPSYANATIQATSVTLNAAANCSNADLDLGFTSQTVTTETGHSTNLAGDVLGDFSQSSGLSNRTDFVGYGIDVAPDQPDGTVIGSYASVGVDPPTGSDTAEWFVLYRCHTDGAQEVIYSCYGDYGGCPKTAATAAPRVDPTIVITPAAPVAGSQITASGRCLGTQAIVTLGTSADPADRFATSAALTPDQGAYTTTFTLPASTPSSIVATVTCGDPDVVTGSASITVAVGPAPTTTTTAVTPTTATPPAAVQTTAAFTG